MPQTNPITAAGLIDKASVLLQDTDNSRWSRAELLGWLNDAQRQLVQIDPTATATVVPLRLASGSKQTIPADGWQVLDVTRNLGTDGATPTKSIRVVSRKLLDAQDSNWHGATPTGVVQNYIFNMQEGGTVFYVYPPSNGMSYVELVYARLPQDLAVETDPIDVEPIYQNSLVDYMVYRAASKDAEHAPMQSFAAMYLESFRTGVQNTVAVKSANDVNQMLKGTM